MTLAEIEGAIAGAVAEEPVVLAAWVFGSRARGEARPGSDLDVAILTRDASAGIEDRLAAAIAGRTGLDVDVSRLEAAGPVLALEVVADGRRIFVRDPERADEEEERIRRSYLDTAHLRRVQNHYLFGDPL